MSKISPARKSWSCAPPHTHTSFLTPQPHLPRFESRENYAPNYGGGGGGSRSEKIREKKVKKKAFVLFIDSGEEEKIDCRPEGSLLCFSSFFPLFGRRRREMDGGENPPLLPPGRKKEGETTWRSRHFSVVFFFSFSAENRVRCRTERKSDTEFTIEQGKI